MFHLSRRKSGHPALCPKSEAGLPTNQVRVQIVSHLQLLLTTLRDQADHGALDVNLIARHEVSPLPPASNQALWAHHSIHSYATEDGEVLSSESKSSHNEGDSTGEDDNAKEDKGGIDTSSDGQVMSDGEGGQECPHTQDTLTGISQVFGGHEDTDPELDSGEKIQSIW